MRWRAIEDHPYMSYRPRYQQEPTDLRAEIWAEGVISPLQLFRIVAWKSAQGLAWVTLNSEDDIALRSSECLEAIVNWRTKDIRDSDADWVNWEIVVRGAVGTKDPPKGLFGLAGVRYPVASAILSLLAPQAFPVIDRWAIKGIYGRQIRSFHTAWFYRDFTEQLVRISDRFPDCRTIHEVDQAVMNAARFCGHAERPCRCLPFPAAAAPTA
jgi:hypothetical protein